jgi:hypothetical protein
MADPVPNSESPQEQGQSASPVVKVKTQKECIIPFRMYLYCVVEKEAKKAAKAAKFEAKENKKVNTRRTNIDCRNLLLPLQLNQKEPKRRRRKNKPQRI